MKQKHYDYLVVGSGLYGATFARQATDAGKSVLVIDKRDHIAGNIYTKKNTTFMFISTGLTSSIPTMNGSGSI